jgi:membrane protease YdiL (CAAX protease family)
MEILATWLKRNLWAVFLAHQAGLAIIAIVFLSLVRRITGRTIHFLKDPIGLPDGAVLVVLSIAVIFLTQLLYRWIKGENAPPLGIALTPRRFLDLMVGLFTGFAFTFGPWASALWIGTASIHDRITSHFDSLSVARILTLAVLMLLLQSVMEETTSRAFPMRLWEHRSLAFRMILPSAFFVAVHLVSEPISFERIGVLFIAGLTLSMAYALTGNIWLASGMHAGANFAAFSIGGMWHAGASVALIGRPTIPYWIISMIMLGVFGAALALQTWYRAKFEPVPAGAHPDSNITAGQKLFHH